jgi:hypothetical protein
MLARAHLADGARRRAVYRSAVVRYDEPFGGGQERADCLQFLVAHRPPCHKASSGEGSECRIMVLPYQFVKRGIVYVLSIHDVAPNA